MDFCLCDQVLSKTKNKSKKSSVFCRMYWDVLSLLLPSASLEAVLDGSQAFCDLRDHIGNICMKYRIGCRLFGSGKSQLMNQDVQDLMETSIAELMTHRDLTKQQIFDAKARCIESIENTSFYENLTQIRKVEMAYRGWTFLMTVCWASYEHCN